MAERVRMVNTNPQSKFYNKVKFFPEGWANGEYAKKQGWQIEDPKIQVPEKPVAASLNGQQPKETVKETEVKNEEKIETAKPAKKKPGRKANPNK